MRLLITWACASPEERFAITGDSALNSELTESALVAAVPLEIAYELSAMSPLSRRHHIDCPPNRPDGSIGLRDELNPS